MERATPRQLTPPGPPGRALRLGPGAAVLALGSGLAALGAPAAAGLVVVRRSSLEFLLLAAEAAAHAGALAALAVAFATLPAGRWPRGARAMGALAAAALCAFVYLDARVWALAGLHLDRSNLGHLLQPGAAQTLGVAASDLLLLTALFAGALALGWLLFGGVPGSGGAGQRRRAAVLCASLCALDLVGSAGSAVARFLGHKPLLGLARAMPLAWAPRADRTLSRLFGHPPMAIDEDFQFPAPARRPWRQVRESPPPGPAARRPDVLLLVIEGARADALDHLPSVRALAAGSLVAQEHWSGGNCSFLGVFTLLGGVDPSLWRMEGAYRIPAGVAAFAALGYEVRALRSAALAFEVDRAVMPPDAPFVVEGAAADPFERDQAAAEAAARWSGEGGRQPRLLAVFFDASHWPYWVAPGALPAALGDDWALRHRAGELRARYLRSLEKVDERVGAVVSALRQAGRLEQTVVVVTGDHGEAFREHGVFGHGSRLDDEQLRVPLVLHLPGMGHGALPGPSVHQDVLPTVLAWMGAPPGPRPAAGIDLLAGRPRARPPLVGSCAIQYPNGFAFLLGGRKLLFQLGAGEAEFVSEIDIGGVQVAGAEAGARALLEAYDAELEQALEPAGGRARRR